MFDERRGLESSSLKNSAEAIGSPQSLQHSWTRSAVQNESSYTSTKRRWPCAPSCEVEPDLLQQMPHHRIDLLADRNLVSRRDLLSARTRSALRPWRVFTEANSRAVPRSGEEGFYCGIGAELQHGGCSFSSRVLSAPSQIQRR